MKTLLVLATLSAMLHLSASDTTCNTLSGSNYFFTSNSQATQYGISYGSLMSARCAAGYVSSYDLSTTSFNIYCYSGSNWCFNQVSTTTTTCQYASCVAKPNWCSSAPSQWFGVVMPSYVVPTYTGASVDVWCKAGKLGNFKGNGTYITMTCGSSADGGTGVWQSSDYCSGGLSIKSSVFLVLIAATVGLVLRHF